MLRISFGSETGSLNQTLYRDLTLQNNLVDFDAAEFGTLDWGSVLIKLGRLDASVGSPTVMMPT